MAVLPGNPKLIFDALMKLFGGAGKQADEAVPPPRSFDPLSEPLSADAYQELPGYSIGRDILDTNRDLRNTSMSRLDPGPLEDIIPSGRVQRLNPERLPDTATKRAQRDDPDFHAARRQQQIEDEIIPPNKMGREEEADELMMNLLAIGDPQRAQFRPMMERLEILDPHKARIVAREVGLFDEGDIPFEDIPF
jgi:hypothetical protein